MTLCSEADGAALKAEVKQSHRNRLTACRGRDGASKTHVNALKAALDAWFDEVKKARWSSAAEVKRSYATASIVSAGRIVFNIKATTIGRSSRSISKSDRMDQMDWNTQRLQQDRRERNRP